MELDTILCKKGYDIYTPIKDIKEIYETIYRFDEWKYSDYIIIPKNNINIDLKIRGIDEGLWEILDDDSHIIYLNKKLTPPPYYEKGMLFSKTDFKLRNIKTKEECIYTHNFQFD